MKNFFSIWNQLTKPRVTTLVLVTALPGLYLGSDQVPSYSLVFWTLLGTFFMSSASFVFNQIIEKDKDAQMDRTKNRPLPQGKISVSGAMLGGFILVGASFFVFLYFVNLLALLCAFGGLVSYVFLYTILLKPRTDQNIVIGGIAGCVGPLIGYAASTNTLPIPAWVLFLIIFLWTPPHFWALAISLKEQYDNDASATWSRKNYLAYLFIYDFILDFLYWILLYYRKSKLFLFNPYNCVVFVYDILVLEAPPSG